MNTRSRLSALVAAAAPAQIALQDAAQQLSYPEMQAQILLAESWLREHGIKRLAIRLDNSVNFVLWDLAAQLADVVCVPVPLFFTEAQQQHVLQAAGIDLLLCPADESVAIATQLTLPSAAAFSLGVVAWRLPTTTVPSLPNGTSKITFTSGTTGTPKGVCLSSENQWRVAQSLQSIASTLALRTHLSALPLAVLLENVAGVYSGLLSGIRVLLPSLAQVGLAGSSQFDAGTLLTHLAETGANSIIMLPQMLSQLLQQLQQNGKSAAIDNLHFVAVGGARVAPELLARADALQLPVYEGYGLSECASVVALNAPAARRAGTVGKPLPHVRIQRAEDGELLIAGNVFLGYLSDNGTPTADFVATGDLGELDVEGYLHIQGRKKHLLITSFGRNVSPEWPESELLAEPGVLQACVFGEGKPGLCAVIVSHRMSVTEQEALRQRVNNRLPDYARLQFLLPADEPFRPDNQLLTSNGRPKRAAIWQRYGERLEAIYATRARLEAERAEPAA